MPAEKSTYACVQLSQVVGHWGGAYPSWCQYSDCKPIFTPRAHARARGYVIGRGVYIYIVVYYIL